MKRILIPLAILLTLATPTLAGPGSESVQINNDNPLYTCIEFDSWYDVCAMFSAACMSRCERDWQSCRAGCSQSGPPEEDCLLGCYENTTYCAQDCGLSWLRDT